MSSIAMVGVGVWQPSREKGRLTKADSVDEADKAVTLPTRVKLA